MPSRLFRPLLLALSVALPGVRAAAEPPAEPAAPQAALTRVTIHPERVDLSGPRAEQRVGVLGEYADGSRRDLSRDAKLAVASDKVARVADGVLRPVGDGKTELTETAGGKTVTVPVVVKNAADESPVNFTREIVP